MKIEVCVHANSKSQRTDRTPDGIMHIYVREPAVEGKANRVVVEVLSELYKTPKSSINLIHGIKSKKKIFEINK